MQGNERNKLWFVVGGVALGVIAMAFVAAIPAIREAQAERRCGECHVFAFTNQLTFLPDDLALRKAFDALAVQGFDTNNWQPETYSQTKAPDGTTDRFLSRNVINDHSGIIKLTNVDGKYRYVQVSLGTNTVECVVRGVRTPSPQ